MPENKNLVPCYNRGCGQMFDPKNNDKDVCQHHPGAPIFHDAYKGWSCCNKKSVDFTEFLNIKGCTLSKHSNVKPPEPEKKQVENTTDQEVVVVRAPVIKSQLTRPSIETEMVTISPNVADSLKNLVQTTSQRMNVLDDGTVEIGTLCKNGGCNTSYQGPQSNDSPCVYHPGCPVFHEGLKFWSCCQKRTTDFNVFLSQPGCTTGTHKWKKENSPSGTVKCRWDWHQTPEYVIVSVYAKKYDPSKSYIKMNPIRLNTKLVFPEEGDATFELDLELKGIVCVEKSCATMTPSKVEIKMKKAEPGAWSKLNFPKTESKKEPAPSQNTESQDDDLVDLSSVEAITSIGKVNIAECTE